ncbi:sigma-70 family RNA polymerase sigma factor [Streptomyces sp. NPDC047123]|uniref:RNA polymerase sigma factor n=1 Tax=Streptomyces sp. NPDC047123 TaxID=3155622 RepID=UPI0033C8261A
MGAERGGSAEWERRVHVRLKAGEAAALGELYDRYARLVHAVAARVLDDEKAVTDVVTEVFTRLWRHPESYDPARYRLGTWLVTDVCRQADRRAGGTAHEAGAQEGSTPLAEAPAHAPDAAGRADAVRSADAAFSSMTTRTRVALHLVYTGNLDYRRAAARLGITEHEVLHRLRTGLQMLSDGLREEGV